MSTRTLNILLIEDHRDSAVVFTRVLQRYGHTVAVAHSVREAETSCESGAFDVLICDLELPDGNGVHLLQHARQSCPAAQGIVISAHSDDRHKEAARKAGFIEYLVKPIRAEDLRGAIQRAARIRPASLPDSLQQPPGEL